MSKSVHLLLSLVVVAVVLSGCGPTPAPTPTPTPTPTLRPTVPVPSTAVPAPATPTPHPPEPTLESETWIQGDYELTVTANSPDPRSTAIVVRNVKTGKQELSITIAGTLWDHLYYLDGTLYVIGGPGSAKDTPWRHELWQYNAQGQGTQLYPGRGVDFYMPPDGAYLAIGGCSEGDQLLFFDAQGSLLRRFTPAELGGHVDEPGYFACIGLWGTDQGGELWGELYIETFPFAFFRIDLSSWQAHTYDVTTLGIHWEYDVNIDARKVAYSDYPVLLDEDSWKEFQASRQKVTLYLYDLDSQSKQAIATAITECFAPYWLDGHTLEYNDPEGPGRAVYTVP